MMAATKGTHPELGGRNDQEVVCGRQHPVTVVGYVQRFYGGADIEVGRCDGPLPQGLCSIEMHASRLRTNHHPTIPCITWQAIFQAGELADPESTDSELSLITVIDAWEGSV